MIYKTMAQVRSAIRKELGKTFGSSVVSVRGHDDGWMTVDIDGWMPRDFDQRQRESHYEKLRTMAWDVLKAAKLDKEIGRDTRQGSDDPGDGYGHKIHIWFN